MKLLIATFNSGKQQEFKRILEKISKQKKIDFELVFPQDLGLKDEVKEIGKTFAENSALKVKHYYFKTKIPTLADDGGLEIPVLNNEPGVKSRRWLGRRSSDQELIDYALEKLKDFPAEKDRQAYLKTCVSFFNGQKLIQEEASIEGYIALKPSEKRTPGYPFRDLLIVSSLGKYYNKLTTEEHDQVNHREKALGKIIEKLNL